MDIKNQVIIITGGGGSLCSAIAEGLASKGAIICLIGRTLNKLEAVEKKIKANKGKARSFSCDVLDEKGLQIICEDIIKEFGKIDGLINGAGGNKREASIFPNEDFFDINIPKLNEVLELNIQGTIVPSKVVSRYMARQKSGSIINISSMAASKPLTRVVGYSNAKAAIDNFTKWLAVELANKYSENIRVNAVAPGFFLAEQNKALLLDNDGNYTERAKSIIDHTPFKRFGKPMELVGICQFLMSESAHFITGAIIPVDGGFSAFSGI